MFILFILMLNSFSGVMSLSSYSAVEEEFRNQTGYDLRTVGGNTTNFPFLNKERLQDDGSYKITVEDIPYMGVYSLYQSSPLCAVALVDVSCALTSAACGARSLYYGLELMVVYNQTNAHYYASRDSWLPGSQMAAAAGAAMWTQPLKLVINAFTRSEDDPPSDICIVRFSGEIIPSNIAVKWPYPKTDDMKKHHGHCIIHGWSDDNFGDMLAIVGIIISNYECRTIFKTRMNPDQFCVTVPQNPNGPCRLMVGGPVSCDGVMEGILSNAQNENCHRGSRVFIVTRLDMNFDIVYQTCGARLGKREFEETTTTEKWVIDNTTQVQEEPIFQKLTNLVSDNFWHYLAYRFKPDDNLFFQYLPVILKTIALLGVVFLIRVLYNWFKRYRTTRTHLKFSKKQKRDKIDLSSDEESSLSATDKDAIFPIFLDPKNGKYYYPQLALTEPEPQPRNLILKRKPLKRDRKSKSWFNPKDNTLYRVYPDPEAFKEDRLKTMKENDIAINQVAAEMTPIYFQTEPVKYYYPVIAMTEENKVFRGISPGVTLPLIQDQVDYKDIKTGAKYKEMADPEEFQEYRNQFEENLRKNNELQYAQRTPIYEHPLTEGLLYPRTAFEEIVPVPRELATDRFPLFYDIKKKTYYDVSLGEKYVNVGSHQEFVKLRHDEKLGIVPEPPKVKKSDKLPVYRDVKSGNYFYPKVALEDDPNFKRKVVKRKKPLKFKKKNGCYWKKRHEYLLMASPKEFWRAQQEFRKEEAKKVEGLNVYFDESACCYYYPRVAVEGPEVVKLTQITGKPPLKPPLEPSKYYIELDTAEEYIKCTNEADFLEKREIFRENQIKEHFKTDKFPVYFDTETQFYYYPESSFLDPQDKDRTIISGIPPLIYNSQTSLYLDPETKENYLKFVSQRAYSQSWKEEHDKRLEENDAEYAKKTPIYKYKHQLYYPKAAVTETFEHKRDVHGVQVLPLLYENLEDKYYHPGLLEEYVVVNTKEEFEFLREQHQYEQEELQYKQRLKTAEKSPLYSNESNGKYYYPEIALQEEVFTPRKIIRGIPPLIMEKGKIIHPQTRYVYVELNDPADFEKLRQETLLRFAETDYEERLDDLRKSEADEARRIFAEDTPIFHDEVEDCYYYPKIALVEYIELHREIRPLKKHSLRYDKKTRDYTRSGYEYIRISTKKDFDKLRKQSLQKQRKIPIYQDIEVKYYPECAFLERDLFPRNILSYHDQLKPVGTRFYVDKNGEKYVQVRDQEEFEILRQEKLAGMNIPGEDEPGNLSPIYHDKKNKCYYYPVVALREEEVLDREELEFVDQLDLDDLKDSVTGEQYIVVKDKNVFLQMRETKSPDLTPEIKELDLPEDVKEEEVTDLVEKTSQKIETPPVEETKAEGIPKTLVIPEEEAPKEPEVLPEKEPEVVPEQVPEVVPEDTQKHVKSREQSKEVVKPSLPEPEKCEEICSCGDSLDLEMSEVEEEEDEIEAPFGEIYYDPEKEKYYYPDIALWEYRKNKRNIIEGVPPLSFDEKLQRYRSMNQRPYLEVDSPAEFQRIKTEHETLQNSSPTKKVTDELPIYENPETNHLFYPYVALYEKHSKIRAILEQPPELVYNPETCFYVDQIGTNYVELCSEDELYDIRFPIEEALRKHQKFINETADRLYKRIEAKLPKNLADLMLYREFREVAIETPIYFDPQFKTYYYPEMALLEMVGVDRKVVPGPPPLEFDFFSNSYRDPITWEKYVIFESEGEFKEARDKAEKKTLAEIAESFRLQNPIYGCPESDDLFYPQIAITETKKQVRELVIGKNPLDFDNGTYFHSITGEKYIRVSNIREFEQFRKTSLQKRREKRYMLLAILDPVYKHSGEYFYPEELFQEPVLIRRKMEEGKPKEKDRYVNLESPKDLIEIRTWVQHRVMVYETQIQVVETPIYYNPNTLEYFFPEISLTEKKCIQRDIVTTENPPLAGPNFSDQNGVTYFMLLDPEDFQKISKRALKKQEWEFRLQRATETPVFFAEEYFYPNCAAEELDFMMRKVIKVLPDFFYDKDKGIYYQSTTGEEYSKYMNPKEFRNARRETLGVQDYLNHPGVVPIYFERSSGKFYYPKLAAVERTVLQRKIIQAQPLLSIDFHELIDILTGEVYIEVLSPTEFKQIRKETLRKSIYEAMQNRAKDTPIYFDPESKRFFYPIVALTELEEYARPFVEGSPPLVYSEEAKMFFDLRRNEPYEVFTTPMDFSVQRAGTPKEDPEVILKSLEPKLKIFHDLEKNMFYYPAVGFEEDIPEYLVEGKTPEYLVYNKPTRAYYDVLTGEKFVLLHNLEDVIPIKSNIHSRKQVYKKDPVYKDEITSKFFYPWFLCPEESKDIPEDEITSPPPLKYYPPNELFYNSSGRVYVMVEEQEQYCTLAENYVIKLQTMDPFQKAVLDNTPIYIDVDNSLYFYPKRVLQEADLDRFIIFQKPFLYCDSESKCLYDPSTGEDYVTVRSPEDLKDLRKEPTATEMAIYYDLTNEEFYFPEEALLEKNRIPRLILYETTIPAICAEGYVEFKTPKDFENKRVELGLETKAVELRGTHETSPVYYDNEWYYYPKESLEEEIPKKRLLIANTVLLRWNPKTSMLYDPWSGKEYCKFKTPKSFVEERQRLKPTKVERKVTVIYHDPSAGYYYYPQDAIQEKYQTFREILEQTPKLIYDEVKDEYKDPVSGEKYVKVESKEEFQKLRVKYVKENAGGVSLGRKPVNIVREHVIQFFETENKFGGKFSEGRFDYYCNLENGCHEPVERNRFGRIVRRMRLWLKDVIQSNRVQSSEKEQAGSLNVPTSDIPEELNQPSTSTAPPQMIIPEATQTVLYETQTGRRRKHIPKRDRRKFVADRMEDERNRTEAQQKWGGDVESFQQDLQAESDRVQRQAYYRLKNVKEKLDSHVVRNTTLYTNPANFINDTLLPFGLFTTIAVVEQLRPKQRMPKKWDKPKK